MVGKGEGERERERRENKGAQASAAHVGLVRVIGVLRARDQAARLLTRV